MEHQKIFPTNIFIDDNFINTLEGPDYTDGLIQNMKKHIEKGWVKRDKTSSHFQTDSFLYNIEAFKPFADLVLKKNLENIKTLKYNVELENLFMSGMWANIIAPGEMHRAHTHSNNLWSGVYFVKSSENASPIQFFDPRSQAHLLKPKHKSNWQNSGMLQFDAEVGCGLIFPSWLMHWVPPTQEERISVSWNIILRGDYGSHEEYQYANI
jgi:uncharacterized protein (TIGR02466 family)